MVNISYDIYLNFYAFSRCFYPKRLTKRKFSLHIYCKYVCSLGIEPTTFALLTQCSTTEPQEHIESKKCVVFLDFKVKENVCKLTENLSLKIVR